jgi:hypothetical protein
MTKSQSEGDAGVSPEGRAALIRICAAARNVSSTARSELCWCDNSYDVARWGHQGKCEEVKAALVEAADALADTTKGNGRASEAERDEAIDANALGQKRPIWGKLQ